MLKNYITIALRNIRKQKFYALINILGLSIGIATCLFIMLYIQDELSFDKFHSRADRTYRVTIQGVLSGQEFQAAASCYPFASTAMAEIPEVELATHFSPSRSTVVKVEDQAHSQANVLYTDSLFFSVFDFKLLYGERKNILSEPNTAVLSKSAAMKFFGRENALGEEIIMGSSVVKNIKIVGIVEDSPANSHFDYTMMVSETTFPGLINDIWVSNNVFTYLILRPDAKADQVQAKFLDLIEKYVGPQLEQFMGMSFEKLKEQGLHYGYKIQPLTDIYLYSHLEAELKPGGDIQYIYIFGAVGIFILLIACVNFMNLATARSANRAKEVGIRKTLGSVRSELIGQFMSESMLYSILAALVALTFVGLLIGPFNNLAGKQVPLHLLTEPWFILIFLGFIILVGIIAGSYPAFYLTSFQPVEVLKGKVRAGFKSSGIRSTLVVFQFSISIILIISTLLIYNQLLFVKTKKLGINKENVLVISNAHRLGSSYNSLKESLKLESGIIGVSSSSNTSFNIQSNSVFRGEGQDQDHLLSGIYVDYQYASTLGIEMKEGRFFDDQLASDSAAIVLNETAAKEMGWGDDAVGRKFSIVGMGDDNYKPTVIGVVKNFHWESLKSEIRPLVFMLGQNPPFINIRIQAGNVSETIARIETIWKNMAPNEPFVYSFLDQEFDALFRAEQRLGNISLIFTAMAIFIACLGLLGLAAFTAEQKTKEIGIRKVLGASVFDVLILLNKDFTKLVLISFVLAVPVSYYFINSWLQTFAFRVPISYMVFIIAGLATLVVAWLTVTYQSYRTASGNPVKALKTE